MKVQIDGLPEIPNTWLVALLILALVGMRAFGIDSFTTAGLSALIGFVTGKHIEQSRIVEKKLKKV